MGHHMVLAYHEISLSPSYYHYRVSVAQLREHLALLASGMSAAVRPRPLPEITFDDGHRSNLEYAFPLLNDFGLRATFFVVAARVGKDDNYISWDQARAMVAAGHQVQSHGWSHRLLTQCNRRELQEEFVRSKQELENRLGTEVVALSAPGGRSNERVIAACAHAGYQFFFHSNPWAQPRSLDGVQVRGRLMVTNRMDARALEQHMEVAGLRRLYRSGKCAAKERLRSALGERLYHRLWCWLANWTPEDGMEVQVD